MGPVAVVVDAMSIIYNATFYLSFYYPSETSY